MKKWQLFLICANIWLAAWPAAWAPFIGVAYLILAIVISYRSPD